MSGALTKFPGIQSIDIEANKATFTVKYDTTCDLDKVVAKLDEIGHGAKLLQD